MSAPGGAADTVRRLVSLLALLGLLVGVPAGLWVLGGTYLPDQIPTWSQVTAALSGPDTGAVFYGLLVVVGWAAWAIFALSVLVEVPAQLRGLSAPRLPGLASSQHLAGLLVAAVIGIGSAPVLASQSPAAAGPAIMTEQTVGEQTDPAADNTERTAPPAAAGPRYTVQPRDTLGRIADKTLGDWTRFDEIFQLNAGLPQPDGGRLTEARVIRPGWILLLPADATTAAAQPDANQVIVEPGDTLSGIAAAEGLASWQPIFDLNAGEEQPGGRRFTNPNLIFPSQVLDIPATAAPPAAADSAPAPAPAPAEPSALPSPPVEGDEYSGPQDLPIPGPPASGGESPPQPPHSGNGIEAGDTGDHANPAQESPVDLAAALAGGGALLAAGIGAALLAARRQRFRRRRAGRTLAATPPALVRAETAVISAAGAGEDDFVALDLALRSLAVALSAEPAARLPDVVAARLAGGRLDLRLHTPAGSCPPAPWTADDGGWWWSLDLQADNPVDPGRAGGRLAPYPSLVSVGSHAGQRWLLDLERIGALHLSGLPGRCEDFSRHLVAELAVNSWSDQLSVTMCGFGEELVDLNPQRLTSIADLNAAAAQLHAKLRDNLEVSESTRVGVLNGRLRAIAGDAWMPEILVVAPHAAKDSSALTALTAAVLGCADRGAVAVVLGKKAVDAAGGWRLTLTGDGRLLIPELDLSLRAPQLTAEHAADVAALLAFERGTSDAPMPAATGDRPWQACSDAAGALLEDVTLPRNAEPPHIETTSPHPAAARAPWAPAVPDSVLPHGTDTYVRASAATAQDVQTLARRAPAELREHVEGDLDQLDRELADWWDPECDRPRLTLLGPVTVRALGEKTILGDGHRRRYEEVITYLATRVHGATVDEMVEALRPNAEDLTNARSHVYRACHGARAWLGQDAGTGENHLRSGRRGPYTLGNVLVDAELFRQLRCRSGVRGRDGLRDLQAALDLVTGPPFDQRGSGYEWLSGLDLTYTAMICDVAHLVVTSTLADGDTEAARAASETALRVAPEDEKVLTDAIWVAFRDGSQAEAESLVARIVDINGGDDEMDLCPSTADAIHRARSEFLSRAS